REFGAAFAKAEIAAGTLLPLRGRAFVSVNDHDKPFILPAARKLRDLGFSLLATRGTQRYLLENGVPCEAINKVGEGSPHVVDRLKAGEVALVINTPLGKNSAQDSYSIRRTALEYSIPYFTTTAAANAAVSGIESITKRGFNVQSLQAYHGKGAAPAEREESWNSASVG
ncbi:MAG: carbamoyl-phosphate synthase large chain, partial [Deltaproteobacteria bacterium]|nr:carbamoyl-phosphate synthase large chain [Deltaproteobacteria bacterium]